MRTELHQRVEQGLALTPKTLQSIEILQLAAAELSALVHEELQTNETLELVRDTRLPWSEPGEVSAQSYGSAGADFDPLDALADRSADLETIVLAQLAFAELDEQVFEAVLAVLHALDGSGFLPEGPEREALINQLGEEGLENALSALGACEPRGLGATGPLEAMLAQIEDDDPDRPHMQQLLFDHLGDLAHRRFGEVARALGVDGDELDGLVRRMEQLDPQPLRNLRQDPQANRPPDLVIERDVRGVHRVVVDDVSLPVVQVDSTYEQMASEVEAPVRDYLTTKLRAARELVTAIEQRNRTLARVGAVVFEEQAAFLRGGPRAIRPLSMAQVADRLELHPSTVSRAVADKWVRTEHGTFPMRQFFDGGRVEGATGRRGAIERVKEIVAGENPREPLSDGAISKRLADEGLTVARRTVAKYRRELGIAAQDARRRFQTGPGRSGSTRSGDADRV